MCKIAFNLFTVYFTAVRRKTEIYSSGKRPKIPFQLRINRILVQHLPTVHGEMCLKAEMCLTVEIKFADKTE